MPCGKWAIPTLTCKMAVTGTPSMAMDGSSARVLATLETSMQGMMRLKLTCTAEEVRGSKSAPGIRAPGVA